MKIALAGNPNAGKTTLFNALTGSNQFVGNWPGVTVEKKEGKLRFHHHRRSTETPKNSSPSPEAVPYEALQQSHEVLGRRELHDHLLAHVIAHHRDVTVIDLPGIYSLSPYSLEEVITRNYIIEEKPDAILNIVDATNLERNLFLTTQLLELGVPVVVALNMMDVLEKRGDTVNIGELEKALGCPVVAISALKGTGVREAAERALISGDGNKAPQPAVKFTPAIEEAVTALSAVMSAISPALHRFHAIKVLEHDAKEHEAHRFDGADAIVASCEAKLEDDTESTITEGRYGFITAIMPRVLKRAASEGFTLSDKIDRIVTHRLFALPIFAAVIFIVYFVSVTTVGTWVTDWTNDGLFGEGFTLGNVFVPGIPVLLGSVLEAGGIADWLSGLILDGIVAGVGAVIGFVPQMLVLFLFLAALESCGYMARIAFILDRIFRRFGLSGKSFIPMLVGTGCGVPGIMASRTIENEKDRRMTVIITTFMPCGAKLPVIALISGALFGGAWWVAPSTYFLGIAAVVISGVILKKTPLFFGDVSPFVMELPAYHLPTAANVLRSVWERGSSFVKKAGTIILLSAVIIWFLSNFGFRDGFFVMMDDMNTSLLAGLGRSIAWIFAPLGFGTWDAAVAAITGLIAKENVVGTMGVLYGFAEVAEDGAEMWDAFAHRFTPLAGFAFLAFNLYCPPCFAAMGAIRREMNSPRWTAFAIAYQLALGYIFALLIYQFGSLVSGGPVTGGTVAACIAAVFVIYAAARKAPVLKIA